MLNFRLVAWLSCIEAAACSGAGQRVYPELRQFSSYNISPSDMKKIFSVLVLTVVGCNQPKVDKRAEGEKVIQLSKEWSRAAAAGDVEKVVGYWADDAFMMSAGEPPLRGKQAIRQMVEESFKMPGFRISWQPQSVEVSDNGDMAYLIEDSQVSFTDPAGKPTTVNNKAVSIWRKQADGSWKNVVDISTPVQTQNK